MKYPARHVRQTYAIWSVITLLLLMMEGLAGIGSVKCFGSVVYSGYLGSHIMLASNWPGETRTKLAKIYCRTMILV